MTPEPIVKSTTREKTIRASSGYPWLAATFLMMGTGVALFIFGIALTQNETRSTAPMAPAA